MTEHLRKEVDINASCGSSHVHYAVHDIRRQGEMILAAGRRFVVYPFSKCYPFFTRKISTLYNEKEANKLLLPQVIAEVMIDKNLLQNRKMEDDRHLSLFTLTPGDSGGNDR